MAWLRPLSRSTHDAANSLRKRPLGDRDPVSAMQSMCRRRRNPSLHSALAEGLLDDLLDPGFQRTAEQGPEQGDVARDVDLVIVDAHLDHEPGAGDRDDVAVGRPIDPLDHRAEPGADLV